MSHPLYIEDILGKILGMCKDRKVWVHLMTTSRSFYSVIYSKYLNNFTQAFIIGRLYQLIIDLKYNNLSDDSEFLEYRIDNLNYVDCMRNPDRLKIEERQLYKTLYSIPQVERRQYIKPYLRHKSEADILEEASAIANNISIYQEQNMYLPSPQNYENSFYLGRCIQFLLDSNNFHTYDHLCNLLTKSPDNFISYTHQQKTKHYFNHPTPISHLDD